MASFDFNGADVDPLPAPWASIATFGALRRVSNQCANSAGSDSESAMRYSASSVLRSIVEYRTGTTDGGPALFDASGNGYLVTAYTGANAFMYRIDGGSPNYSQMGSDIPDTWTVGDLLEIVVDGGDLVYKKNGVELMRRPDATYRALNPAIFEFAGNLRFDNHSDGVSAALQAYFDRIGTRGNRPGRSPYSKGNYKRPSIDAFPVVVPVVFTPVVAYADRTGTRENRPGRGPYSTGRYFVRTRIDVGTTAQTYNVAISEAASAADSVAGALTAIAALSETASGADALTAALVAVGALTEAGSATDTDSAAHTAVGSLVEAASGTDIKSAALVAVAALTEAGSAADTLTSSTGTDSVLSEAASAADTLTAVVTAVGVLAESGSAADVVASIATLIGQLSEAGSAADIVDGSLGGNTYNVSIAETASASDAITAVLLASAAVAETGNATDAHASILQAAASLVETGAAADSLLTQLTGLCSLTEVASALDMVTTDAPDTPRATRIVVVSATIARRIVKINP